MPLVLGSLLATASVGAGVWDFTASAPPPSSEAATTAPTGGEYGELIVGAA